MEKSKFCISYLSAMFLIYLIMTTPLCSIYRCTQINISHSTMSDKAPKKSDLQFKLSIESPSLNYAARPSGRNVVFAVDMPYPLLRSWYDIVNGKKSTNHTSSSGCSVEPNEENTSSTRNQYHNLSYCDLFESCIPCGAFSLVEDVRIRQDMNESLRKRVLSVMDAYKHTKGRKRLLLDGLKKRFQYKL